MFLFLSLISLLEGNRIYKVKGGEVQLRACVFAFSFMLSRVFVVFFLLFKVPKLLQSLIVLTIL